MADQAPLILGEFSRRLDDRYRLSIPAELGDLLTAESADCVVAKERSGCLSLWSAGSWHAKMDARIDLIRQKMQLGDLDKQVGQLQTLGRLLSTRHRPLQVTGRGRVLIPEGFREFLGVEPGDEVMIVGAAVCVEIWRPVSWISHLEEGMPAFRQLFDELTR